MVTGEDGSAEIDTFLELVEAPNPAKKIRQIKINCAINNKKKIDKLKKKWQTFGKPKKFPENKLAYPPLK